MFKVQVNGVNAEVKFQHSPARTDCLISDNERNVLLRGFATLSPRDQYVKETGRRVSLTKAIRSLPRDERKWIWQMYWEAKDEARARSVQAPANSL